MAKDGRFGVYVTDGETNASLRKGDMVETLTLERACELLAERRAAAPRPAKRGRGPVKKATARPAAKRSKTAAKKAPRKAAKAPRKAAKAGAVKKPAQ